MKKNYVIFLFLVSCSLINFNNAHAVAYNAEVLSAPYKLLNAHNVVRVLDNSTNEFDYVVIENEVKNLNLTNASNLFAPTITPPGDVTIECDESILPGNTGTATAIDNDSCGNIIFTYTDSSNQTSNGSCTDNSYTITRTWRATETCTNTFDEGDQVITVVDTTAPTFTGSITTSNIEGCDATDAPAAATTVGQLEALTGNLLVSDNCTLDANLTVSHTDSSTGTCPLVITRTYTVTDACTNDSADIVHTINIDDTTAPTFTGSITTSNIEGCDATDAPAAATTVAQLEALTGSLNVSDNCTADGSLTVSHTDSSNGTCPLVITRTYTVTDACTNDSADIVHTINIDDTTAPTFTGSITTSNIEGCDATDAPAAATTVAQLEALTGSLNVSDNCTADGSLTVSHTDSSNGTCPLVITRTYTVTDACTNDSADIVHTINIDDTTAPTFTGSITTSNIEGCDATDAPAAATTVAQLEALTGNLLVSDNCTADVSLTVSHTDSSNGTCPLVITRTYTVTDACTNDSADIVHTINIDDTTAPTFTGSITTSNIEGCDATDAPAAATTVAQLEALTGNLLVSDNCTADVSLTVSHTDSSTGTCPLVITRTYTVTDACTNDSADIVHTINIDDTTAPTFTGSITTSNIEGCDATDAPAAATTVAQLEALTGNLLVSDNCTADVSLTVSHTDSSTGTCPLVITRTYTVTDACTNDSADIVHTINIDDTTAPTFTGSITTSNIEGCDATDAPAAATTVAQLEALTGNLLVSDNCTADVSLTVSHTDSSTGTCPLVITRTYTVTDACTNDSADIVHTINIDDTTAPTFTGSITTSNIEGCDATDAPAAATTVAQLEALTGSLNVSDNCTADGSLTVSHTDSSTGTCPLVITRTYTVTDACTNDSADIVHTINIDDTTAPTFTGSITTSNIEGCDATDAPAAATTVAQLEALTGNLLVSDNCTADVSLTVSHTDSSTGTCPLVITRTYTVTDACTNDSADIVHTINIDDTTAPTFTGSITTSNIEGCDATDAPAAATTVAQLEALTGNLLVSDNCTADVSLTVSHTDSSTGTCPLVITRTYTVTDACTNDSADIVHTINIDDTTAPTFTGSITTSNIEGCDATDAPAAATTVAQLEALTGSLNVSDNCTADGSLTVSHTDSSTGTCPLVITRTYTVTDACTNDSADIVHTINIDDTTAPTFTGSITTSNIEGCDATDAPAAATTVAQLEALTGSLNVSDNCTADGSLTVSHTDSSNGTCPLVITRTYTVTDACTNDSADIVHTINIDDTTAPTFTGSITTSNIEGCDATDAPAAATTVAQLEALTGNLLVSDNCTADVSLTVSHTDSSTGTCPLVITRTYTVTDACTNDSADIVHTINIDDTTAPTFTGSITTSNIEGCDATDAPAAATTVAQLEALTGNLLVSDNCTADVSLTVSHTDSSTGTCPLVITRTYTVTDACTNDSADIVHTINIDDTTAPTFTGSITTSNIEGCDATDAPAAATTVAQLEALTGSLNVSDNCTADGSLTVSHTDSSNGTCPLVITRTYTVTDACTNDSADIVHTINIDDTTAPTFTGSITTSNIEGCDATDAPAAATTVAQLEALTGSLNVSDNCTADGSLTVSHTDSSTGTCPLVITRTYTVTDACTNDSADIVHTINIDDTTAPTFTGSITTSNIEGCDATDAPAAATTVAQLEALTGNLLVSDNCTADVSLTVSHTDSSTGTCPLVITRTYTVTDACTNDSADIVHTINIDDTTAPTFTGSITTSNIEGCDATDAPAAATTVAQLEALTGSLNVSDNCTADGSLTVSHTDSSNGTCPLVITRTYTVTDACTNDSADIVHTINIDDTTAPTFTGSITTSNIEGCDATDAPAAATTVAQLEALTGSLNVSDNCTADGSLTVSHTDSSTGTCPLVITRTYTVTDACTNDSADIVHTINIDDTTAPTFTGSITTSNIEGCDATDAPAAATTVAQLEALTGNLLVSDNCTADVSLTVSHTDSSTGTCPLVITRTYTVTDACTNDSADIVHTINIDDTTAPTFTGSITTSNIEGCDATDAPAAATTVAQLEALTGSLNVSDNCTADGSLTVSHTDSSTGTCPLVITRTYTVTDACTNDSADIVHTINIDDTTAPTFTGSITTSNIEGCDATDAPAAATTVAQLEALTGNLLVSDNCTADGSLTVSHTDSSTGTCPLVITRTYTVTDACTNDSADIVHTINIDDTTAPTFTGSITTSNIEGCDATDAPAAATTVAQLEALTGSLNVSDNCTADGSLTVSHTDSSTGTCPLVITRTYTVTDACTNDSADIVHTINIDDSTAPVITTCLGNQNVSFDSNCGFTLPNYTSSIVATDNCSSVTITQSPAPGTIISNTTTITITATDACGNSTSTCSFDVIPSDTTNPTALCQNVTVQLNASGVATVTAAEVDAGSTDNCGIASVALSQTSFDCTEVGNNTVTLTVTDVNGNSSTCTATVLVEDNVPPTALCQNITVQLDAAGNATIVAADIDGGSTDNCSTLSLSASQTAFTCANLGTNNVTLTVDDGNGQTDTCVAVVTVEDNVPPVTPNLSTVTGQCSATAPTPTTTDNCGGTITGTTSDALSYNTQGAHIITWNFDDGNGNNIDVDQTVFINDSQDPIIVCQDITINLDETTGTASITSADIDNGTSDNCNFTLSLSKSTFDCTNIGPNIITLTATDDNGNTSICTSTVTVVSPSINGGVLVGHLSNISPTPPDSNVVEVTACPLEPQNALMTVSGYTGNVSGFEYSTNGGLNWIEVNTSNSPYVVVDPESGENIEHIFSGDTFTINNVHYTTLVRAIINIGSCEARSSLQYLAVIPPDLPPTIIGPSSFDVCMGVDITVNAESAYGVNPGFNEGGLFNSANLNNLGWTVDGEAEMSAGGNNTNNTYWKETNGPKKFNGHCYETPDNSKFAIVSGVPPYVNQTNNQHLITPLSTMETPIFNTLGLASATLEFDQAYYLEAGAWILIELSLDNGSTYPITLDPGTEVGGTNIVFDYTGPSTTGFADVGFNGQCNNNQGTYIDHATVIDLQSYIGMTGLRIRFTYYGVGDSSWAIDNISIPQAPIDEVLEWTDNTGVVVTTGSTTTIAPVTPGQQTYGVTSLINGCRAEGNEGTEFVDVAASLSYAGEDIVQAATECGESTVQLKAYDNSLRALENIANGVWDPSYQIPQLVTGDHDNDINTPDEPWYPTNYVGTGKPGFWEIESSTVCNGGGTFIGGINNPNATFKGDPGVYTLKWTVEGCPSYMTVTINSCDNVDFDGVNDYITFKDEYDLNSSQFSIEVWVKPESVSGIQTILSKRDANTLSSGYDLRLTNNILSFNWNNGGTINTTNSNPSDPPHTLDSDRWFHIAVTFGSGIYKLYVDGILIKTTNGSAPSLNSQSCLLGAMDQTGNPPNKPVNYFNGWMDEFRIWNKELTEAQIHHMMNQEIDNNGGAVLGEVVPLDVPGINWSDLDGYYRMNILCSELEPYAGTIKGKLRNIYTPQQESAPLPYISNSNGLWTNDNIWLHPSVWDVPNSIGIDNSSPIDWNIVRTGHNISSGDKDITVLGLLVDANELSIEDPDTALDETNEGQMLWVTHYLKLDGKLDLVGESQLIQKRYNANQINGSIFDNTSSGIAERDQQGTSDAFNYNYFSAPFAPGNAIVSNENTSNTYSIGGVLRDGTTTVDDPSSRLIVWTADNTADGGDPTEVSTRWLYAYNNRPGNTYSEWQYLNNTGTLNIGLGYTQKGSGNNVVGSTPPPQNYVFVGLPNNGTITNTVSPATGTLANDILLGNPYSSAIDAEEFIRDNIPGANGNPGSSASIDGSLYFWEHYNTGVFSHTLELYEGGYGIRNITGGNPALSPPITQDGITIVGGNGTITPSRYIPVAQGFFVTGSPGGGLIKFENDQRAYYRENGLDAGNSIFFGPNTGGRSSSKSTSESNDLIQRIRLNFKSPEGAIRTLLIGFTPNNEADDGYNYGYDAHNYDDFPSDLSWSINNEKFIIQGVGAFDTSKKYPFILELGINGSFEISLTELENFDSIIDVYIYDAFLETYTKFNETPFEITMDAGDYMDRYYLAFINPSSLSIPEDDIDAIRVNYLNDTNEIYINWINSNDIKEVELINIIGQSVKTWTNLEPINSHEIKIPVKNISEGNYVIKVMNNEGMTTNKKVIITQ